MKGEKSVIRKTAHINDFNHVSSEVKLKGITEFILKYLLSIFKFQITSEKHLFSIKMKEIIKKL